MADDLDIDTKVSSEGRVVIPSAVRSALGVGPGDHVRFVVTDGEVRLVTARSLLHAVWANNHGGDAGDSAEAIRVTRTVDLVQTTAKWDRVTSSIEGEERSESQIEEALLEVLGIDR